MKETTGERCLRPCPEESVDYERTQNLYIEGDNLAVLQLLRRDYAGKVRTIYIDPPYNTGNDFVYHDDFTHTEWQDLMRPRLQAAKELLSEDGAIFISIDHHEMVSLVALCDDLFGTVNRVGLITVVNNLKGRSDDAFFATCNEFLLVYTRDRKQLALKGFKLEEEEIESDYHRQDETSRYKLIGFRKTGNAWKREERPYMFYPVLRKGHQFSTIPDKELRRIYDPRTKTFDDAFVQSITERYSAKGYEVIWPLTTKGEPGRWRWGVSTFHEQKDINLEMNEAGTLCTKMRATIEDGSVRMKSAKTLWYKPAYDTGSAARQLARLMGRDGLFQNPKSLVYIKDILRISTDADSIVLDFFSGSATTAHAVMALNAEDGGKRRFVMVQLPEATDEQSEAYKAGYKNICEIGKERLRRAGKRVLEELRARQGDLKSRPDVGFRVLKLEKQSIFD